MAVDAKSCGASRRITLGYEPLNPHRCLVL